MYGRPSRNPIRVLTVLLEGEGGSFVAMGTLGLTASRAGKFSITEVRDGSHAQAAVRVNFSNVRPASIVQSSAAGRRRYRGAGRRRNLMERWAAYVANEARDTVVPMVRPTGRTGP